MTEPGRDPDPEHRDDAAERPGAAGGGPDRDGADRGESSSDDGEPTDELPRDVVDDAERLTRLARNAVDPAEREAYLDRRESLLESYDFTARVRTEDDGDVLVLHPAAWHDGDVIRTDRIEDVDRAVEIPLEGAGDPDDWDAVDAANRELVAAVRTEHGDVHGDNAAAFADFVGNHYARPVESATKEEIEEFLGEYFVRNAWPSDRQRAVIEESIERVFEAAEEPVPEFSEPTQ